MSIVHIAATAPLTFGEAVTLGNTQQEPLAKARTAAHQPLPDARGATGIWECSPGSFRRQVAQAEYSYIVSGAGTFTPDNGEPVAFAAGDALYFPANTHGTWTLQESVRKTYVILE
ncbi:Cupin domain protein [compost metagenome]|uniref:cupin domain-containing protein n=1 Tax=Pseudomonas TaxID=286 RepID=UPI0003F725D3|nr:MULTISPECIES: cupin domain-containing protein [Pseudomonas]MCW2269749.1 putative cupin superfamily protein [Pseudomonas sp. JUb96]PRA58643.1 cupin domain-containing protein [Pseudomonas sp. MYb187]